MPEPLAALTAPQFAALEVLLEGRTQAEAAASAAVDVRTVRRWLAQPPFRAALHDERASIAAEVHGRLQSAAFRAVDALDAALQNTVDVRIRIRAAQLILQLADRAFEAEARSLRAAQGGNPPNNEPLSLSPRGSVLPRATRNEGNADNTGHAPPPVPVEPGAATETESPDGRLTRPLPVARPAASASLEPVKTGHAPPEHPPVNATKRDIGRHQPHGSTRGRFHRLYLRRAWPEGRRCGVGPHQGTHPARIARWVRLAYGAGRVSSA